MRPDLFLATIGRGSNGSNALEVTEDRAAVTAESQDNIINRVNNLSQYGPSWHYVPGIGVAGTAYAEVPGSALGDLAFSRASSKTRTNSAGVVETIASNVPPHDYRNADGTLSTFPRLNLEPQRTNSTLFSDQLDNAAWTKDDLTVTVNATTSPDGTQNADKIVENTTNAIHRIREAGIGRVSSGTQTASCFFKAAERSFVSMRISDLTTGDAGATFNLSNGTGVNASSGSWTNTSFTISNYGSGWYRCTVTGTQGAGTRSRLDIYISDGTTTSYAGTAGFGLFAWGAQIELGASYATTYIPTTTAAVTRLADAASKTGVSSLIGQTEGTLFAEVNWAIKPETGSPIVSILTLNNNVANIQNSIILGIERDSGGTNRVYCLVQFSNVTQAGLFGSTITSGNYKIALAYKQNDFALYVNGAQIATDPSGSVPTTSQILLGQRFNGDTRVISDGITQAALFPTRLTNAQLAQLTTL